MVRIARLLKLSSYIDPVLRWGQFLPRLQRTIALVRELRKRDDLNAEQVRVLAFREHKRELGKTVDDDRLRLIVEIAYYFTGEDK